MRVMAKAYLDLLAKQEGMVMVPEEAIRLLTESNKQGTKLYGDSYRCHAKKVMEYSRHEFDYMAATAKRLLQVASALDLIAKAKEE